MEVNQEGQEKVRIQKRNKVLNDLQSNEEVVVNNALDQVEDVGDVVLVPALIELVIGFDSETIKQKAFKLLASNKHEDTPKYTIQALKKKPNNAVLLYQSIWEAGHPMEGYLEDLTELALDADYTCAIEIMSILDTFDNVNEEAVKKAALQLKESIETVKSDVNPLLESMIDILTEKLIS